MRYAAFKYRIYPNKTQQNKLNMCFGCSRKFWNLMLDDRNAQHAAKRDDPDFIIKYRTPASFKETHPYLRDVDSLIGANCQMDLNQAFKNHKGNPSHFKYPKFKSKYDTKQSFTTNNQKGTVRIEYIDDATYLKIPKFGSLIRIRYHREYTGLIKSITISKHADGNYFASILCETDDAKMHPATGENLGIDLGVTSFAVFSNELDNADNQRFGRQQEIKLKREKRKLSKMAKIAKDNHIKLLDAKNYQKQKRKVAQLERKVMNQRLDFLHKLSTNLIKNHDIIVIEDLNVKGMLKNRKLAKHISDVSWSNFVRMLEYKADWYGRTLITIDRWYPSSKLCSTEACDYKADKMPLSVREWMCPQCNVLHNRDKNAAINILREGLRIHGTLAQ